MSLTLQVPKNTLFPIKSNYRHSQNFAVYQVGNLLPLYKNDTSRRGDLLSISISDFQLCTLTWAFSCEFVLIWVFWFVVWFLCRIFMFQRCELCGFGRCLQGIDPKKQKKPKIFHISLFIGPLIGVTTG